MDWLANNNPPWYTYQTFMSRRLSILDKQPAVHLLGIREPWLQLIAKWVLKVTRPEANYACKDDQIFEGLKAGIYMERYTGLNVCHEEW